MTSGELLRSEAAKWLRESDKDRNAARLLLEQEPSRSVFHSQPAAEKAAKAFLTFHQVVFRKTHDLAELGVQCAAVDASLETQLRQAADLTDYASAFRYPDAPYEPGPEEAAEALHMATALVEQIRLRISMAGE